MTFHITKALRRNALLTPDAPCLSDKLRQLSYAAVTAEVDRVVKRLYELGCRPGDAIGTCSRNSIEVVELMHAAAHLGLRFVTFNHWLRSSELSHLMEHSQVKLVLADASTVETVVAATAGLRCQVVTTGPGTADVRTWASLTEPLEGDLPRAADDDRPFWMMYTSGTTGSPKAVLRTMDNTMKCLWYGVIEFGYTRDDTFLALAPMFHGVSFLPLMVLQVGGHVVVHSEFDPAAVIRSIHDKDVTASFMVPTMLHKLTEQPDFESLNQSSMRVLITGAAPSTSELKRTLYTVFPDSLYEFYGATETGFITVLPPAVAASRPGSCGRVAFGMEVGIFDDLGNKVPTGAVGEIATRCDGGFTEYFGDGGATATVFNDGWFPTGDLGRIDESGFVYILDRKKDVIISGGENIYPREVEDILNGYPGIAESAVVGVPDVQWGEKVQAFVVAEDGVEIDTENLQVHCRTNLAGYKCPSSVQLVPELPKNSTGKILKRELRRRTVTTTT
jgi:acyl-CoA synthetase (AMP-forming)/AMP-acid ligase II